jgi:hypothetical protein
MKVIAFYLPQYYAFPENDKWWGKGFTEWTNVRKSKPLYKGHYQPTVPLNENYYTLDNPDVMKWQADLAKKYGVYGFCFYHYWFGEDRMLMEKPTEMFLKHKEIDFPFCFSWANHNWSRTWVGGDKDILMDMRYGDEKEWDKHFEYLLDYFNDSRYIKIDGNPAFVIYKPDDIPCLKPMLAFFDKKAKENGFNGITILSQAPVYDSSVIKQMDYVIEYEPNYTRFTVWKDKAINKNTLRLKMDLLKVGIRNRIKKITNGKLFKVNTYDYDAIWNSILKTPIKSKKTIAGAFVNCDVTPRRQDRAVIYKGATPEKFGKYMKKLVKKVEEQGNQQMIFVSAWNEWGEGMYLEPDEKNKYGYLEGIRDAVKL